MLKKFLSTIGIGSMKVDTIVDQPDLAHGESLSGKIYIDGGQSEQMIDFIKLEVIKRSEGHREDSDFDVTNDVVAKYMIETIGSVKSKETRMVPFEIMPDERWEYDKEQAKLFLRTSVHITGAVDVQDEDEIRYN
ncbi:MAG: sporulation protein [Planococcaceae bacterium]|nr:sporulation protein [Bacillota bacterium]MDX1770321.1 sporulation protein [Planococcaceae bacterium]